MRAGEAPLGAPLVGLLLPHERGQGRGEIRRLARGREVAHELERDAAERRAEGLGRAGDLRLEARARRAPRGRDPAPVSASVAS